jgi:hypothetical protein
MLNEANLATLLIDLLTPEEELIDLRTAHLRFDMAEVFTGKQFGPAVGDIAGLIVAAAFALLLLAAVNTAIADIVAILFLMSRDGELPDQFQLRPSTSSFTIARVVSWLSRNVKKVVAVQRQKLRHSFRGSLSNSGSSFSIDRLVCRVTLFYSRRCNSEGIAS